MDYAGARVTSKSHIRVQTADEQTFDVTFFEGQITTLFIPWLVTGIPERAWQVLQENLKIIIKSIRGEGVKK